MGGRCTHANQLAMPPDTLASMEFVPFFVGHTPAWCLTVPSRNWRLPPTAQGW